MLSGVSESVSNFTLQSHKLKEANRLKRLPPYVFTVVDSMKARARSHGIDVIDLSMGSPDIPPPEHVIKTAQKALEKESYHRYSRRDGDVEKRLRKAIAGWYKRNYGVDLDPETEVLPLIGSKEGIAHFYLSFLNIDDIALVPAPAYPVHFNGAILAGGILYNIPVSRETGYLPDLSKLDKEILRMAKTLMISYPHNPTTATAPIEFYEEVVKFAKANNIIVGHDFTYSEIVYDGHKNPSFLQAKDAKKVGIEFHTLSKTFSMAGWRIGFAVGNAEILKILAKTKSYVDFGIFRVIQEAAIVALNDSENYVKKLVETYRKRRDILVDGLNSIGWKVEKPRATFYVWARIPLKYSALTSLEFVQLLIEEAGVAVAPGTGFGEYGEGYVRFALVENEERIAEAIRRIHKVLALV